MNPAWRKHIRRQILGVTYAALFTIIAAASFLGFIATGVLWQSSHSLRGSPEWHVSTKISHVHDGANVQSVLCGFYRGRMGFGRFMSHHGRSSISELNEEYSEALGVIGPITTTVMMPAPTHSFIRQLGFAFLAGGSDDTDPSYFYSWINMPCWFGLFITGILPVAWLKWFRHRLRVRRCFKLGLCLNCGYDPRGNVSEICPECGRRA